MKITEHIDALEAAGRGLAEAAEAAGPDAEVPTCPGWRVRDLLRHTTMVHRWATTHVAEGHTTYQPGDGEPALDGDELLAHYREGHAGLVAALRAAPETLECWTFLPAPSPLAFWARRQTHETTVHRADAESALTTGPGPVDPRVAADGIDELLRGFHGRDRSRVRTPEPRTLRVRATDTGDVWTVRLSATEPPRTEREARPAGGVAGAGGVARGAGAGSESAGASASVGAAAVVPAAASAVTELSGPADRLYLTLWNRLPADAVTLTGDEELARLWRETSGITWS
ncbi:MULTISPECIES: maleylpyruvate isomerase family mycothiol-dependent enzyme [Streptomyces]|uniref:maleylpyruvate isomerase family mycothiol-dependent enzyme n=1 Tax=Streptomyces TaxID=1883 RepID=UPI001C8C333B|nr:maleylpyruvate isomerase family mycothiol-dependent enzyme [Streptomyces lateritius]MBX9426747.1 maleylpyruvate isomerase family mycothiol-dependent enzyme [Streptomyces lateritius]